jgi:hypothetical protein
MIIHKYFGVYVYWWLQTKKLLLHIFEKKNEIRETEERGVRSEGEKRVEREERKKREMRERGTMLGR